MPPPTDPTAPLPVPVPAPVSAVRAEPEPEPLLYCLDFCEGVWELYTLRGSKGRTKQVVRCFPDYPAARRAALTLTAAAAARTGSVLTIRTGYRRPKEVHRFPPTPKRP